MSSPRRSSSPGSTTGRGRRSSARSARRVVAVLLLLVALVAGVGAIIVGSPFLVPGVVAAIVAVTISARLLNDESAQVRRDWARDRAALAHRQTREATIRSREHTAFADHMAGAVRASRAEVERVLVELSTTETSLAQTERARAEATERAHQLESELTTLKRTLETTRGELRQAEAALAESEAAQLQTRAELLAWQQSDEVRKYA